MTKVTVALDKLFKEDGIDALHGSSPDAEAMALYNRSAETYDEVSSKSGYVAHRSMVNLFDQNVEKIYGTSRKNVKVLDVGAGTGIIGANLKEMGYNYIDAVDISQEMLKKAEQKDVYKKLICAALCADAISEIPTGFYDAMISVAALTAGHIKPPAFNEMLRHVRPGGILCFTIRRDCYEREDHYGYQTKMAQLEQDGKWELISKELIDYYSNVDEKRDKCYAIVYKVIKH